MMKPLEYALTVTSEFVDALELVYMLCINDTRSLSAVLLCAYALYGVSLRVLLVCVDVPIYTEMLVTLSVATTCVTTRPVHVCMRLMAVASVLRMDLTVPLHMDRGTYASLCMTDESCRARMMTGFPFSPPWKGTKGCWWMTQDGRVGLTHIIC